MAKNYFLDTIVLLAKEIFVLRDVVAMMQDARALFINLSDKRAFENVFKVDIFANQIRKVEVLVI